MACQVIFDDITLTTGRSCLDFHGDSIHKWHNGFQMCSFHYAQLFDFAGMLS